MDAANAKHNGTVVFDYDAHGDTATVDAITINNRCYITINGNVNNCNNPICLGGGSPGNEIMHSNLTQVRGDAAILLDGGANTWDANLIHNNYIGLLHNSASPPGEVKVHYGEPDGLQTTSGISIYRNTFKYIKTSVYMSTQHPDILQLQSNYIKIYDNEFINIANSGIDYDTYANSTPHDVWIYNNLFRIVEIIDTYPEYFRFYLSM